MLLLDAFKIADWHAEVTPERMRYGVVSKHRMLHPYSKTVGDRKPVEVDVEVEGEIRDGVPHG